VELENYMNNSQDLSLRGKQLDTRVHACLYFMAPHRLKDVDVEFMQRLHGRVNVIPVIAKADTMTTRELSDYKALILNVLKREGITIYPQPQGAEAEEIYTLGRVMPPFAVIGSNETVVLTHDIPGTNLKAGNRVAGRAYPWGVACIEDNNHCDVGELRRLIVDNFISLRDATEERP
jgi:septin family protein